MTARTRKVAVLSALSVLLLGGAIATAFADEPHGVRGREHDARGQYLDNRYNHGHYYPERGAVVRALPEGYRPYYHGGSRFYFSGGIWYAPGPGGFVVVRPPAGLFIAALPPFYTTVWLGGLPYYYADDTYYSWRPDLNGYVVVDPPAGADQPGVPPPSSGAPANDFYLYPKNGQSAEQQSADRYECHSWAKSQTGFDPTAPGGGVPGGENASKRDGYRRAITACLEARGYSVK
jgi:hypothetical protein